MVIIMRTEERKLLVRAKVLLECVDTAPLQDQADLIVREITELLAQPESTKEPEAWILEDKKTGYRRQSAYKPTVLDKEAYKVIPLYTAPQKREPIAYVADASVGFDVSKSVQGKPLIWLGTLEYGDRLYRMGKDD